MKLSVIRHGVTEANEKKLYCGITDVPLSEQGRLYLNELKKIVVYPVADVYITSGLTRTTETLRILYDREPDITIEEFRELNHGDFEMKSYRELKDNPDYQRWIGDIYKETCPNGESGEALHSRVKTGLDKLNGIKADSAVIICHGGVIVSIMEQMFPKQRSFYEWDLKNGRGYTFEYSNGKATLISEI